MSGPNSADDAQRWVREAFENGRYMPRVHFKDRCRERGVTMTDIEVVFARCRRVEPYPDMPKNGGTCWRFFGLNVDGDQEIAVGIEAFEDDSGQKRITLCTVLPPREIR
jgi:hypothetical protein